MLNRFQLQQILFNNATESYNPAMGYKALVENIDGFGNAAIGEKSSSVCNVNGICAPQSRYVLVLY
jgi:hypothetical protein